MANNNILLVGGGVTSSLVAFFLRNHIRYTIDVWEAQEELGGRMRTLRSKYSSTNIDLGAQYITTDETRLRQYQTVYDSLISHNILKPLTCIVENLRSQRENACNYVAPAGTSSLVEHFFHNSNIRNIRTSHLVECLSIRNNTISAKSMNKREESFQAVVLTAPIPDILEIEGSFRQTITDELLRKLNEIKYSTRFVLVLIFNQILNVPWAAKYLPEDEIFRYVAIQEKKVQVDTSLSSVVLHTSVEFGTRYCKPEEAQPILVQHAQRVFPQWPQPIEVHCYKWNYSQVISSYKNSASCIVLCTEPLIIVTGDAFTASNFDGCIAAASSTADTILEVLGN